MISIIIPTKKNTPPTHLINHLNTLPGNKEIIVQSGNTRAKNMNAAAKKAKGNILLFLHQDTHLPKTALLKIEDTLQTTHAGAFSLSFKNETPYLHMIATLTTLRSKVTVPYGDQAIFMTKQLFNTLKGYKDLPFLEDVDLMKRAKKYTNITILKEKVITSPEKWKQNGMIKQTLKNRWIMLLYTLGIQPKKLKKYYF